MDLHPYALWDGLRGFLGAMPDSEDEPTMKEPPYTQDDASRELARLDCANYGHEWRIVTELGKGPILLVCNCGDTLDVVRRQAS